MRHFPVQKLKSLFRYGVFPGIMMLFFITFFLVYNDFKRNTINEFNKEQLLLAKTASQGIVSFFDTYESQLNFLSNLKNIAVLNEEGKESLKSFYKTNKQVIQAITRVDSLGVISYTYPENPNAVNQNIAHQSHVKRLLETRKTVISDVFMSVQGYLSIAMHVPVFERNTFVGSLAILIPIDQLGEGFIGGMESGKSNCAWLLSANGTEIYCPIDGHKGSTMMENTHNDTCTHNFLNLTKQNIFGTFKGIDVKSDDERNVHLHNMYISFYRAVLGTTYWTICMSYDEREIYLAISTFRNRLIIIFTLLFIIVAFYFYSLAKVQNVLREEGKRRKAELKLKKSEEKFRLLFEEHVAVKLLIDQEHGFIVDANKAAASYFGWDSNALRKMNVREICLPPEGFEHGVNNATPFWKKERVEFKIKLKNGELRDVEVTSSLITLDERVLSYSIIHDISKRKRAEATIVEKTNKIKAQNIALKSSNSELEIAKNQAEESNRLKTAFLQNMSHEIRTPMNAILGFTSLLFRYRTNEQKFHQFTKIIEQRSRDLLKIIDNVLDIAKIESGVLPLHEEECDLKELFDELHVFFNENKKVLNKEHIALSCKHCAWMDSTIMVDKVKLRQIFINLIGNAFKFTVEGKIDFGCYSKDEKNHVFYVSDTGVGIPSDKQNVVFERFHQLDSGLKTVVSGTGLGLPIVKGLLNLLQGDIWLESEVGKGTTFYFSLSLKPYSNKVQVEKNVQLDTVILKDKNILIVEDDAHNTTLLKTVLGETQAKLFHTAYGKEAIEISKKENIDLILMDILLPDLNGYDTMVEIQKDHPDVKVIAQTAYGAHGDKQKAFELGCVEYLSKPLDVDDLLRKIAKHLI